MAIVFFLRINYNENLKSLIGAFQDSSSVEYLRILNLIHVIFQEKFSVF